MIPILDRINSLARKQREEGLSEKELGEQKELRKEYLGIIRGQVLNTISGLTVLDPVGNDVTPERLKSEQENYVAISDAIDKWVNEDTTH
ncbi:hypothetical protein D3C73_592250 [compost metagenome]